MREVGSRYILIVEDDASIREALTDLLRDQGYTVQGAENGRDAYDCLRTSPSVPRLLIVDLMMPVMNGQELCAELLTDEELSGIPFIVISADTHLGARVGDLGAAAYFTKPLDVPRLLATLEQHCPA